MKSVVPEQASDLPDPLETVADDLGDDLIISPSGGAASSNQRDVRTWVVTPAQHGLRLDRALAELIAEHSRSHLQALIDEGAVELGGLPARLPSKKVQAGQTLRVDVRPTAQSQSFTAEPMSLAVVFEDEHLLVVNKPAGLVVHPAAGHWHGTLMNGLLAHHAAAAQLPRAGIVHRLDKDTSGLMVVAKSWEAMHGLSQAIAARAVSRQYLAIIHGPWAPPQRIDAPIGRDPVSRVRMAVVAHGKPAQTDVHALMSPQPAPGVGMVSAVRCVLHTGRTHQIRVHLAHRGHPLVGDPVYGGREVPGLSRQALHAAHLAFHHPVSGQLHVFTASLPDDLMSVFTALGWDAPEFSAWSSSGA